MFLFRASLALGLVVALTAAVLAAPNRALMGRGQRGRNGIEGIVVRVHHDRGRRGAGWIKVRRSQHHRYGRTGAAAAAVMGQNRLRRGGHGTTFAVNSSTRFERMGQGGNGGGAMLTSFHTIRTGEHVRIVPGAGQRRAAREVVILRHGSNRSGNRRHANNRSFARRRNNMHRRHSLVGSRVLARHGHRQNFRINRPNVRRVTIRRPIRHTLIHGRVAQKVHHHTVAHHVAAKAGKNQVKHVVKQKPGKSQAKHTTKRKSGNTQAKHAAKRKVGKTQAKHVGKQKASSPKHSPAKKPAHRKR